MSLYEQLGMLFADEFCVTFTLLNNEPIILPTMLIFGGYNLWLLIATSAIARLAAAGANYLLGKTIFNIFIKYSENSILKLRYKYLQQNFDKYSLLILCGCFIPVFGNFVVLLAGIAKYRVLPTMSFAALSSLLYYFY